MLKIKDLKAKIDEKDILTGINLEIKPGEVHQMYCLEKKAMR
jgi:Fe-S cluster assembly ATP-binding protein